MDTARKALYKLAHKWQNEQFNPGDHYPFVSVLDEVLFHADLRFKDYIQYQDEGEFPVRLEKWLGNVAKDSYKQTLFKLLPHIIFIDRSQMRSLYRDAYRRIIVPWVSNRRMDASDMLSIYYEKKVKTFLHEYRLLSITESFRNPSFLSVNNLSGLPRPIILGEDKRNVPVLLPKPKRPIKGLIVFEDFVGTGNEACRVLAEVSRCADPQWKVLFVPIIILQRGLEGLMKELKKVEIKPVLIIRNNACLQKEAIVGEPDEFKYIRALVKSTATRVLEQYEEDDDPPEDPFGYKGSGARLVTYHNTPNNTLPLIHHRSHNWFALFRRIHHSKDGL